MAQCLAVFVKDIGGQFRINKGAMVASDRDLAHQIWGPVASGKSRPPCWCSRKRGPPPFQSDSYEFKWLQRSRPNGSRSVPCPDGAETLPVFYCLSNVCRRPPPRSRLPVRVAVARPRQVKAAQEAGRSGAGALVLALTGVAHLSSRTGGSYPLLGADAACASAGEAASTWCPCCSACCSR